MDQPLYSNRINRFIQGSTMFCNNSNSVHAESTEYHLAAVAMHPSTVQQQLQRALLGKRHKKGISKRTCPLTKTNNAYCRGLDLEICVLAAVQNVINVPDMIDVTQFYQITNAATSEHLQQVSHMSPQYQSNVKFTTFTLWQLVSHHRHSRRIFLAMARLKTSEHPW